MKQSIILWALTFLWIPLFAQTNISDSLQAIYNAEYHDSVKVDRLNERIFMYAPSYPELVVLYSDSAIELSSKMNDSVRLAHSITRKGVVLYYLGDYNKSLENYFLAINIKEESGNFGSIWREYNNIGLILKENGQYSEALEYFRKALKDIEKLGLTGFEALILNNMGLCYRGMNQYKEATDLQEKSLTINLKLNLRQAVARNYNNLGNLSKDQGNYQEAMSFYRKAIEINKQLENKFEIITILNNMADASLKLDKLNDAERYLNESNDLLKSTKANQLKLINLNQFADLYSYTGQHEKSASYYKQYALLLDSLSNSERSMQFEQLKLLANAEKEIQRIEFLEQINAFQEDQIRNLRIIQYGGGIAIALILSMLIIVLYNLRIKKQLNHKLREHIFEEETLNEELKTTNEELQTQRDNLSETIEKLKNTQEKLIQAEKMASLGVLASGVAHEINNPLNFIKGGVFGLNDYVEDHFPEHTQEVKIYVDSINEGIDRAADIVKSLSHYSHQSDVSVKECRMHEIIDNCLNILRNKIEDKIKVNKRYTSTNLLVKCNEGKMHQAILNILSNAAQAIPGEGEITIETIPKDSQFHIAVSDSGNGISKENMSKIFDPFFTTKSVGEGTGLGLSITYNIIKELNGSIEIESELYKGTSIRLILPLVKK